MRPGFKLQYDPPAPHPTKKKKKKEKEGQKTKMDKQAGSFWKL
jgi:hypothetical protein